MNKNLGPIQVLFLVHRNRGRQVSREELAQWAFARTWEPDGTRFDSRRARFVMFFMQTLAKVEVFKWFCGRSGIILKWFWNDYGMCFYNFRIVSELFLDGFVMILGSFWDCLGIIVVSFWDDFGIVLGWFWDRFGIVLGWFWDCFRMNLGSFWECFGIVLELFFIGFIITRIEAARSAAENSSIYIYILYILLLLLPPFGFKGIYMTLKSNLHVVTRQPCHALGAFDQGCSCCKNIS